MNKYQPSKARFFHWKNDTNFVIKIRRVCRNANLVVTNKENSIMVKTLIVIEKFYTTRFQNREGCNSEIIETKDSSLSEYYDNLPKLLEKFNKSPNFQKEIDKAKNQLENQNFADLYFEEPFIKYYVTIVPPKFK